MFRPHDVVLALDGAIDTPMSDMLKQPWVWVLAALVAIAGAVLLFSDDNDEPRLVDPSELTGTVSDVADRTNSAIDVTDRALTETVTSLPPVKPGYQGFIASNEDSECVWLVGVGTDSNDRFAIAWPSGTEINWQPLGVIVPGQATSIIDSGAAVTAEGRFVSSTARLDDQTFDRILDSGGCPHEAVFVAADSPTGISVQRPG
jgi:hypothetical protein